MHCRYQIEEAAIKSIQDIDTAKKVLQQIKEEMLLLAEKAGVDSVTVAIFYKENTLVVLVR